MNTTTTQYGVDYQGRDLGLTFASREDVNGYIARAIEVGNDAADYQVKHRTITTGTWAPTTPAPAQMTASQSLEGILATVDMTTPAKAAQVAAESAAPVEAIDARRIAEVEATEAADTLGPCGCTDYHLADCPLRTGGTYSSADDIWAAAERRGDDDGYYDEGDR